MHCPNCKTELHGENNCPNCGAKITYTAQHTPSKGEALFDMTSFGCISIGCIIPSILFIGLLIYLVVIK